MAHDDLTHGRISVPGGTEAVGDLAVRVLSVLNARQVSKDTSPKDYVRDLLHRRITSPYSFDPMVVLEELQALNISNDAVIDDYIPDSAERIGADWVSDEMDFAAVTIASLRLQCLLNEAADTGPVPSAFATHSFGVLMVMPETEQHTLGGFVAAAQLRRKGAFVDVLCAETVDGIVDAIHSDDFDVVMFSCSSEHALASVREIALKVRNSEIRIPTLALGGLIVNQTSVAATDYCMDVVTNDITEIASRFEKKSTFVSAAKK